MKSLLVVFCLILFLIATPFVFSAINTAVTENYAQSFAGVTTDNATYAANVTLGKSLFRNNTTAVVGIASNVTSDTPTASGAYNSITKKLEVSGLNVSQTRTLSVSFMIASTSLPTGAGDFLDILLRWFWVFTLLGMSAGAIYAFFQT